MHNQTPGDTERQEPERCFNKVPREEAACMERKRLRKEIKNRMGHKYPPRSQKGLKGGKKVFRKTLRMEIYLLLKLNRDIT